MARGAKTNNWLQVDQVDHEEAQASAATLSADSEFLVDAEEPRPSGSPRRLAKVFLLALASCLVVGLTLAAVRSFRAGKGLAGLLGQQTSMQELWVETGKGIGCANWRNIALAKAQPVTPMEFTTCGNLCASTSGCAGFGYQPEVCPGDQQLGQGYCYLWSDTCGREQNPCWNQYQMLQYQPVPWTLTGHRTGCSNFASIKMQETIEWNANACGEVCSKTAGCVGFNFQPDPCDGPDHREKGACDLFNGACEPEINPCWDLYGMTPQPVPTPTPPPTQAPKPDPHFKLVKIATVNTQHLIVRPVGDATLEPLNLIKVGNTESATYETAEVAHTYETPDNPGTITVDTVRPLKHSYAEGTPVTVLAKVATAEVTAPAEALTDVLFVNHLSLWDKEFPISIKDSSFGEMTNTVKDLNFTMGTIVLEVPLAFAVPEGAVVSKIVAPKLTGQVEETALKGTFFLTVADIEEWKKNDNIEITPPPLDTRRLASGDSQYNVVADVHRAVPPETKDKLECKYPLQETVPKMSTIVKVNRDFTLTVTTGTASTTTSATRTTITSRTATTTTTLTSTSATSTTVTTTTTTTGTTTTTTTATTTTTTTVTTTATTTATTTTSTVTIVR